MTWLVYAIPAAVLTCVWVAYVEWPLVQRHRRASLSLAPARRRMDGVLIFGRNEGRRVRATRVLPRPGRGKTVLEHLGKRRLP